MNLKLTMRTLVNQYALFSDAIKLNRRHSHISKCVKWKWKALSRVRIFATPWTVVHGILQARLLEWVGFPFSSGSSRPRNWTRISCIAGGFFSNWALRVALRPAPNACLRSTGIELVALFLSFPENSNLLRLVRALDISQNCWIMGSRLGVSLPLTCSSYKALMELNFLPIK